LSSDPTERHKIFRRAPPGAEPDGDEDEFYVFRFVESHAIGTMNPMIADRGDDTADEEAGLEICVKVSRAPFYYCINGFLILVGEHDT